LPRAAIAAVRSLSRFAWRLLRPRRQIPAAESGRGAGESVRGSRRLPRVRHGTRGGVSRGAGEAARDGSLSVRWAGTPRGGAACPQDAGLGAGGRSALRTTRSTLITVRQA